MAHGDARVGKWRGNGRMQWVASTLHTTSEHGVSNITTADAHTSAASSRLNWRHPPADLNGLVRFARKTKSGFCACAVTFQLDSTMHQITHALKLTHTIFFLPWRCCTSVGKGVLFIDDSISHSDTPHSVGLLWTSDRPDAEIYELQEYY